MMHVQAASSPGDDRFVVEVCLASLAVVCAIVRLVSSYRWLQPENRSRLLLVICWISLSLAVAILAIVLTALLSNKLNKELYEHFDLGFLVLNSAFPLEYEIGMIWQFYARRIGQTRKLCLTMIGGVCVLDLASFVWVMIQVNQPFLALQCFLLEMAVLYVILTAAILYPYVSFRCPSRDGQAEEAIARIKRAKRFKYFQLFCCIVIFIYHGVGVLLPPGLRVIYVWIGCCLSNTATIRLPYWIWYNRARVRKSLESRHESRQNVELEENVGAPSKLSYGSNSSSFHTEQQTYSSLEELGDAVLRPKCSNKEIGAASALKALLLPTSVPETEILGIINQLDHPQVLLLWCTNQTFSAPTSIYRFASEETPTQEGDLRAIAKSFGQCLQVDITVSELRENWNLLIETIGRNVKFVAGEIEGSWRNQPYPVSSHLELPSKYIDEKATQAVKQLLYSLIRPEDKAMLSGATSTIVARLDSDQRRLLCSMATRLTKPGALFRACFCREFNPSEFGNIRLSMTNSTQKEIAMPKLILTVEQILYVLYWFRFFK